MSYSSGNKQLVCDGCGRKRSTIGPDGVECSWAHDMVAAPGWTMWVGPRARYDYCQDCELLGNSRHALRRDGKNERVTEVLVVGEVNPFGSDPKMALYHLPRGSSGNRLRRIMGLRDCEYAGLLHKVNLCSGKWSDVDAYVKAKDLLRSQHEVLVLLGARVRRMFGGPAPFERLRVHDKVMVGLPHPSGRCRLWNDPESFVRARTQLILAVPQIPWGRAPDTMVETRPL